MEQQDAEVHGLALDRGQLRSEAACLGDSASRAPLLDLAARLNRGAVRLLEDTRMVRGGYALLRDTLAEAQYTIRWTLVYTKSPEAARAVYTCLNFNFVL